MPTRSYDLTRTLFAICISGLILLASLKVLAPFLLGITWATMIVVASWPLMITLEKKLGGRRWAAILILISVLLLVLFLPFMLAIITLIDNSDQIVAMAASLKDLATPQAPDWLSGLPVVGERATQLWSQTAALGLQGVAAKAAPYAGSVSKWFAGRIGSLGMLLVQILLAILISAIMYANGEYAASAMRRFARKLGGQRGDEMVILASGAIRGVALGVGVTAIIQAVLGGIGLAVTGLPFAALLTAVMLMLCVAQIGVLPILAPAILWLYWHDSTGGAIFLLIWMLIVVNLDNVLRPWLIRRGADLPLLLILAGVIGGIISYGLVGIFLGPLLLAVTFTLLKSWLSEEETHVTSKARPKKT